MPPLRRLTHALTVEEARPILAGVDPIAKLAGVTRLHGGSTEVYRLDLAGGAPPLVLKLYPDEPVWSPGKERLVAGMVESAPIPTPRWLKVDESRALLPMRYAVTSWLPGTPLRDHMAGPGGLQAFRAAGALLRRLHDIPMPAYGYILDHGIERPRADNLANMTGAFERAFKWFSDQGGDADLARRLEAAVAARIDILAACDGPKFLHDDFQPGNVLVERDGDALRLTGLVDFGNAQAGDPLMDLAKSILSCAHEHPPGVAPLREGYGPIDHPDPERAIWLYLAYHRTTLWAYLKGFGAAPDELLRDLAEMVAQGPVPRLGP